MDDALAQGEVANKEYCHYHVLILVVMDDALAQAVVVASQYGMSVS